ncbi:hypothetical protein TNCV_3097811 [Trichonephila clavipes]|nr:hypothetical protein TNCV_3097811 [Trichonephila clavipes]
MVVKRALAAALMCLHERPLNTIGLNIEAISSSTCIISTAPAADVLAPSFIRSVPLTLLSSWNCLIHLYGVISVPLDCS